MERLKLIAVSIFNAIAALVNIILYVGWINIVFIVICGVVALLYAYLYLFPTGDVLVWHDGTRLYVNRYYLWTGVEEISYGNIYRWKNHPCQIKKIEDKRVTLFDLKDKQECIYSIDSCSTRFKPIWKLW